MKKVTIDEIISVVSINTGISIEKLNVSSCSADFDKWDSIAHVRIMVDLEKLIKKKISTSEMAELDTIKKIQNYLK